jgi:hypothetical protein
MPYPMWIWQISYGGYDRNSPLHLLVKKIERMGKEWNMSLTGVEKRSDGIDEIKRRLEGIENRLASVVERM